MYALEIINFEIKNLQSVEVVNISLFFKSMKKIKNIKYLYDSFYETFFISSTFFEFKISA